MRVLVYGGTGAQTRPLVHQLVQRGHIPHVLTRNPAAATALERAGARLVEGNISDALSLRAASRGIDAVVFMIPAFVSNPDQAVLYARTAMQAAVAGGVRLVAWNTSGRLPKPGEKEYSDSGLTAILDILRQSGLPLIVIAPTTYMENLMGPWTAESVRTLNRVSYPVLPSRRMGWIAARDVGQLILAALERPDLAGSIFRVSGLEAITGPELAQAFSDVLARPITYYTMSPIEMQRAVDQAYGDGSGAAVADEYGREQMNPDPPRKYYDMTPVLRQLPVRMTSVREWITENVRVFKP